MPVTMVQQATSVAVGDWTVTFVDADNALLLSIPTHLNPIVQRIPTTVTTS